MFFLALMLFATVNTLSLAAQKYNSDINVTKSELGRVKRHLIFSMKDEQKNSDCAYTIKDISKVDKILSEYYDQMEKYRKKNKSDYMILVKTATQSLNDLNTNCSECLIGKEQGVIIIEFISKTAYMFGFIDNEMQDLTVEWRKW
ncbi:hypothetical protein [Treponema zioleckii]|uniref:hypothetical protein n=1 Tax=Treponema zioleckii TaxID=331680 RepID=UPI00168AC49A|nr:hypothetical protein [Treponema zioleckii]